MEIIFFKKIDELDLNSKRHANVFIFLLIYFGEKRWNGDH